MQDHTPASSPERKRSAILLTMFRSLLHLLLLLSVPTFSAAQSASGCASAPPNSLIDLANLIITIQNEQPYTAGVNESYCVDASFFGNGLLLGTMSFTSVLSPYPFEIVVTDVTTPGSFTSETLSATGDFVEFTDGNRYFFEVIPLTPGIADVTFTAAIGGAASATVEVEAPLPVTWQRPLAVRTEGKRHRFDWSVSDERNVAGYTLEADTGAGFRAVAGTPTRREADVEVNYEINSAVLKADTYYRVRQTDLDGGFSLSNTVFVAGAADGRTAVYPNPAREAVFYTGAADLSGVRLLDAGGGEVSRAVDPAGGRLSVAGLRPGVYLLELTTRWGERSVRRVVVR